MLPKIRTSTVRIGRCVFVVLIFSVTFKFFFFFLKMFDMDKFIESTWSITIKGQSAKSLFKSSIEGQKLANSSYGNMFTDWKDVDSKAQKNYISLRLFTITKK